MNSTPNTTTTVSQAEIEQIEKELLELILKHIEDNSISADNVQSLAQEFLAALPIHDKKDLLQKLNELGKKYPEAQTVYLHIAKPLDDAERERKLHAMAEQIKTGNLEQAIAIAKGDAV